MSGENADSVPRRRVGVFPGSRLAQHSRLLGALEERFHVRFHPCVLTSAASFDAVLVFEPGAVEDIAEGPTVLVIAEGPSRWRPAAVELAEEAPVPAPLRGRSLEDQCEVCGSTAACEEGDRVLARADGRPVWWERPGPRGRLQFTTLPLPVVRETETVRDHLRPGRFAALAPLFGLIQRLSDTVFDEPPLRAAFVLDDPNLHWRSYGHVDYARLVRSAAAVGYHVVLATVPLDGWLIHPQAAQLVRDATDQISLAVHGNDHVTHELGRLESARNANASMAQALRRVAAIARRSGIPVDRVMVPPHERCSEAALRAMFQLGFDAACISRPHPWRDGQSPLSPALGLAPAELVAGGLPVLPRHPLGLGGEELIFRAWLRQPLIVYGHHQDLADGVEVLERMAAFVNSLGAVRWGRLGWIAQTNVSSRMRDADATVLLYARRAVVSLPSHVRSIRAEIPSVAGGPAFSGVNAGRVLPVAPAGRGWISDRVPLREEQTSIELELAPKDRLDPADVPSPRRRAWPVIRRALAEQRDRLSAFVPARTRRQCREVVMLLENHPYPQDTRVRNEAEALVGAGHQVTVIAPRGDGQRASEEVSGVTVRRFRCPVASGGMRSYLVEYVVAHAQLVGRGIREVTRGADVVHVHAPPDSVAIFAALARVAGRAVVFDLHDSWPELLAAKFGDPPRSLARLLRWAQRAALRYSDRVIVTNESQRDLVISRGARSPEHVSIVRNGPRVAEFREPILPRDGRLGEPHLIYVGTLDVQDGVLELPELLTQPPLARARLTVVGDGTLFGELVNRFEARKVADRVTMTGRVAHAHVPHLIAGADICIDPAPGTELNHGSTMIKIAEYLAAGRPVVAYALRETKRTASDAALYAPCGDLDAFAALVAGLASDPTRRIEMAQRARARSEPLMWERSAGILRGVYGALN